MTIPIASTIPEHRSQGGFTLLEMLVALTVLGFLVIGLNQGVHTGLGLWNMQARRTGEVAELASTVRVIRMLLTGIPVAPAAVINPGSPPLAISLDGTPDRLAFVGDLPTGLGTTRRADITLVLQGDRLVLTWTPHRPELAGAAQASMDTALLRGIASLQFAYFGAPEPGSPPGWLAQWEGPAIPGLIRVRLSFSKGDTRRWPDLIVAPQMAAPES